MKFRMTAMLLCLFFSCGSLPTSDAEAPSWKNSTVELQYVLGRDHYQFVASADETVIQAHLQMNHQTLEKGVLNQNQYPNFLYKVLHFVRNSKNKLNGNRESCPSPFVVKIKAGQLSETVQGCRTSDPGEPGLAFSKLVRECEFLLYSKNSKL